MIFQAGGISKSDLLAPDHGCIRAFQKVELETCPQLQSANALFEYLLPCANYSTTIIDMYCLEESEIVVALTTVPDWSMAPKTATGPAIKRTFKFYDFQQAFFFMLQSAQLAETNQHHPNWSNLYNVVEVTLNTDDKHCLSTFDFELAQGEPGSQKHSLE